MQAVPRAAGRSARLVGSRLQTQQKRLASHEAPKGDHGHDSNAHANESFGPGFFIALLGVPAAIGVYQLSQPGKNGEQPYISRKITEFYAKSKQEDEMRNTLHTDAIEQAAADRLLFLDEKSVNTRHIQHRYPESLNGGSPYMQRAGHSHSNIDAVIDKYQKEAYEANEIKLQQLKDNKVPAEQPYKSTMTKTAPAAAV